MGRGEDVDGGVDMGEREGMVRVKKEEDAFGLGVLAGLFESGAGE